MSLCINPKCLQPQNSDQVLFCESCGSEMLLNVKYQAVRLMSNKGGFGDTYEVSERGVSKVLKVLKSDNAKAIELFNREFRVLKNLTNKNILGIPHVKDFFLYHPGNSSQDIYCLVMERINGLDLEEYLRARKKPIDEKMAIGWISQLADILEQVHNEGILHRDIKPSNIMLQPDGQLVLIDFGAAKEAAASIPGQSTLIYTPGYAAPEQHQTGRTSPKSDFFALGRTFVYLLTATHPIELYDSYNDAFLWRNRSKNISPSFLDLIDRLMQEEPHLRPKDVTEIIAAIKDLSDNNLNSLSLVTPDQNLFTPPAISPPIAQPLTIPVNQPLSITPQPVLPANHPLSITQQPALPANHPLSITQQLTVPANQSLSITQQPTVPDPQLLSIPPQPAVPILQPPSNIATPTVSVSGSKSINKLILILGTLSILGISVLVAIGFWPNKNEKFTDIDNRTIPSGTFKVGGSTTWATSRQSQSNIENAIQGAFSKFKVVYADANSGDFPSVKNGKCLKGIGSKNGICWLIEGDLAFAQSSAPLKDSIDADKVNAHKLKEKAVAYSALGIVVHPDLGVSNLTLDELRNIYLGKITNWKQVNGPDLAIKALSRDENSAGSASVFKEIVLEGEGMGSQVKTVNSTNEGLNTVVKNNGGIYFGAAKEVIDDFCGAKPLKINGVELHLKPSQTGNCSKRYKINRNVIESKAYPLINKIYIVIKADGSINQQAGEAYVNLLLTKQGQEKLEDAGFASINK
jgi:serine/threonine protein kinase